MLKLEISLYLLAQLHWFILIPIYLCLSPLCMISSDLFDWLISYVIQDQTVTLVIILVLEWTVSAALIFQLMWDRTGKSIFFYEFVFFITCSNCILIGVTYSLLKRDYLLEQLMAKICSTLLLVLIAQRMKIKYQPKIGQSCQICFNQLDDQCIFLRCKHIFHENCLWQWVYVKQECPTCKKAIN